MHAGNPNMTTKNFFPSHHHQQLASQNSALLSQAASSKQAINSGQYRANMVLSSNTTQGTNINIQQSPEVERTKTFDKQMTQNLLRFSSGGGNNITEMTE